RSASRAPIRHRRLAHPQLLGNLTRRRPLPPALLGVRQQSLSQMLVEWSLRVPAMRNNQRPQLRPARPCHAPTLASPPPTATTGMGEVLPTFGPRYPPMHRFGAVWGRTPARTAPGASVAWTRS